MDFGIYVHTQGPGGLLKDSARILDASLNRIFDQSTLGEIDAIYISFQAVSRLQVGVKVRRLRVRRNHDLKLITGGRIHYNCMVECDIELPDCDVIEADSEHKMLSYLKGVLTHVAPKMFGEFPPSETASFLLAIGRAGV